MTKKSILITGSTDGIGLESAKVLASLGHRVLLHGRNAQKLDTVHHALSLEFDGAKLESYVTDLSDMLAVEKFAETLVARHPKLDVVINNAGVFMTPSPDHTRRTRPSIRGQHHRSLPVDETIGPVHER